MGAACTAGIGIRSAAANLSARSVMPSNLGVRILYGALPTVVVTSAGELEPSPHLRGR
jgi:hypothetical protein